MFDVPELVALLVQYLSPRDISRCMATCKTLAMAFEAHLYEHVLLGYGLDMPTFLSRNLHRIRTIQIHWRSSNYLTYLTPTSDTESATSGRVGHTDTSVTRLTNLQQFMLRENAQGSHGPLNYTSDVLNTMMDILSTNHRLTHIKIEVKDDLTTSHIGERLLEALRKDLPLLQHLFILSGNTYKSTTVAQATKFLSVCFQLPQLIHLQYLTPHHGTDARKETPASVKMCFDSLLELMERTYRTGSGPESISGCRLKSLALPQLGAGYPESFLIPLLKTHLPNLERFEVPVLDSPYEDSLEKVVSGYCSKLKHVSCFFEVWSRKTDPAIAVIRGCAKWSGLKSFDMLHHGFFGESLSSNRLDPGRKLIATLMEYHSTTLEEVNIQIHGIHMLWNPILRGCPNLKSFRLLPLNSNHCSTVGFSEFSRDTWACTNLRELRIHLSQQFKFVEEKKTAEREVKAFEEIFRQIGSLTKLEVLDLDYKSYQGDRYRWVFDSTLERKWFMGLGGLKELRSIGMPPSFWMRQADQSCMEFMDAKWPRLESIMVRDFGFYYNETFKCFQGVHWEWLRRRNPHLKFGDTLWM
ncbi:hypothetical protein BGX34_003181 [Mortierella sp. NVP85]|nr:hypothetical protein BGX34_003181 [Mortierella sp. NVP85]